MLATLGELPTRPGWAFELKWDGVRAVAYVQGGSVRVISRNDLDVTGHYPELAATADLLAGRDGIVDGEIVALDEAGRPSFARLQERMHVRSPSAGLLGRVPVGYHIFDVLHLDGRSNVDLPYGQRRDLLAGLETVDEVVRVPPSFVDLDGPDVLAAAAAAGLEGVIGKRLASIYQPGRRSPDWVKVPLSRTQEVVIIGYKPGGGRRAGTVGSLVLAIPDQSGGLTYVGGVGTGFTAAMLADLHRRFVPLHRTTPPAPVPRDHRRDVHWVEPVLVGEVAYRNQTPDGRLRHPSWRGLRPDRDIDSIRPPQPQPATGSDGTPVPHVGGAMQTPDGAWHVEAVGAGGASWYRIVHGTHSRDWLTLDDVQRVLAQAGIDLSDLQEAPLGDE
jgi:bifunctional non-homologous end joining protein LigD